MKPRDRFCSLSLEPGLTSHRQSQVGFEWGRRSTFWCILVHFGTFLFFDYGPTRASRKGFGTTSTSKRTEASRRGNKVVVELNGAGRAVRFARTSGRCAALRVGDDDDDISHCWIAGIEECPAKVAALAVTAQCSVLESAY
jgi:hypothetical protein